VKSFLIRYLVVVALVGCASTPPPTIATPVTPPPVVVHGDEKLNAVLWIQAAAEYRANALQAFNGARFMLERALADPTWTALGEQTGNYSSLPPAVILDIDETIMDNSPSEARRIHSGNPFSEEEWQKWVDEAKAEAIPGALEFTQEASRRGVTVFYISNRRGPQEAPTRANMARLGFPLDPNIDTAFFRAERPEWQGDKGSRRREVASRYRVLLLVGDDLGDFTSAAAGSAEQRARAVDEARPLWGTKWIVLPNPVYGSWERVVVAPESTPEGQLRRKLERLNDAQ
jgi:5'-nucleotidase (lipoprotein e(P4) family)